MASIQDRLFEKIKQEFGVRGLYAVEMLETANHLLKQTIHAPRQSSAAAYCIRQAIVEIFQHKTDSKYERDTISKEIVDTRRRFSNPEAPTKDELQKLLEAVDKLKTILEDNTRHKTRLAATIKHRTGRNPWSGEDSPLEAYQQEIDKLNGLVHNVSEEAEDVDVVRRRLERVLDILARILLPTERRDEIIKLAEMSEPQRSDARHLREVMVSVNDFDLFTSKVQSATWFRVMDRSMLKPPSDNSPWLVGYLVRRLKDRHRNAFVLLIQENWGIWTENDDRLGEFAHLLYLMDDDGLDFLIKLLQKDPTSKTICYSASKACSAMQASNPLVVKFADLLLNQDSGLGYYDRAVKVPAKLVEGITDLASSEKRINVLILKLQDQLKHKSSFYMQRYASVANLDVNVSYPSNALLTHLRDAFKKGKSMGNSTSQMVKWLTPLQGDVQSRLVAWLYSVADDVDCLSMVDFVTSGCQSRSPTGDDIALLDRLGRECNMNAVATQLTDAIGKAPELNNPKDVMRQDDQSPDDVRRTMWAIMMKNVIDLPEWEKTLDILAKQGIDRDALERSAHVSVDQTTPFGVEQFDDVEPYDLAAKIASWRPNAKDEPNLLSVSNMCYSLSDSVKRNTDKWIEYPIRIIKTLQHPTYITFYFDGISNADGSLDACADRLIQAVRFAHTHPWQIMPLGQSPLEYDIDWQNTDMAGINLIRTLIGKNVQMNDESMSDVWKLVCESASYESTESSMQASDSFDQSSSIDSMSDIDTPRKSAIDTMPRLIQYAKDNNHDIPKHVLEMLTALLLLTGQNGAECRSVLASSVHLLRSSIPNWFEQNEPLLFGHKAPESLAQLSLDAHLKYGYQDENILKKYKKGVLDAVRNDVERALDHLMLGMFLKIDGYDQDSLVKDLARMGAKYVSLAGTCSARLLWNTPDPDSILQGVSLWRCVLDSSPCPEALAGYGMWAHVSVLEQRKWEDLTLRTCKQAKGKLEWTDEIAKRVDSAEEITDSGLKILKWTIQSDLLFSDKDLVAEHVLNVLRRSKDELGTTTSWTVLSDALLDRGHHHEL